MWLEAPTRSNRNAKSKMTHLADTSQLAHKANGQLARGLRRTVDTSAL